MALGTSIISSPSVQKHFVESYTSKLSKELNARVSVGRISYSLPATIRIEDLFIGDQHQDTLFYIKETKADFKLLERFRHLVRFGKVSLEDVTVKFREYESDDALNFEFFFDYLAGDGPRDTTKAPEIWTLIFEEVSLKNASFALKFDGDTVEGRQFNESDFRFNSIYAELQDFHVVDDSLAFYTKHLSLKEKNSFQVKHLSTDARIHSKGMRFSDLSLVTANSQVSDYFEFAYDSWRSFNNFEDDILMIAEMKEAKVSFKDLSYFSDVLLDWDEQYTLSGKASGPLSSMKGKNIRVQHGAETSIIGNFSLRGLPDIDATLMSFELDDARSNMLEISEMTHQEFPENFQKLGKIRFQGAFTGFLDDFVAFGDFQTALGQARTDINMKLSGSEGFSGSLALTDFDLGILVDNPSIGKTSLQSKVNGHGYAIETMEAKLEGKAGYFELNSYAYKDIKLDGLLKNRFFEGNAKINDDNLQLTFTGKIDMKGEQPIYDFVSQIYYADIARLGYMPENSLKVLGKIEMDAVGGDIDNLIGTINLRDVRAVSHGKSFYLDSLKLSSGLSGFGRNLHIQSDVLDLDLNGQYKLSTLDKTINNYLAQLLPNTLKLEKQELEDQEVDFTINFKRSKELTALFVNETWLDKGIAKGHFNSARNEISLDIALEDAHYDNMELKNIHLSADSTSETELHLKVNVDQILVSDSAFLSDVLVDLHGRQNLVDFKVRIKSDPNNSYVKLNGLLDFSDTSVVAKFNRSFLNVDSVVWAIHDTSKIQLTHWENLDIPWFRMESKGQSIQVEGRSYGREDDRLKVDCKNFDLSTFNTFLFPNGDNSIAGKANGTFNILSFKGKIPLFTSDLEVKNLQVNSDTFGDLSLTAGVKSEYELITVNGKLINGSMNNLRLSGFVKTGTVNNGYNLELSLDSTKTSTFQPFLTGLVSELKGTALANVRIFGPLNNPQMDGYVSVLRGGFLVDYLNTYYEFSNRIAVSSKRFELGRFNVVDQQGGRGFVSGYIAHNMLSDFRFNIELSKLNKFLVLNTSESQSEYYYGKAVMTGSALFTGTVDNLKIDVKGTTEKGTALYVPMENYGGTSELEFIRFVNMDEGYESRPYQDLSGIEMNFDLDINPNAEIQLIFDSRLGDIIRARGNSEMNLRITSSGDFKMFGIYEIVEGDYLFTAVDLINKKYIIQKGGTITWNGDPLKANLNLQAIYKVQASPGNLVAGLVPNEDLSSYRQKVGVEAIMKLRGELTSPDIRFGIRIPDMSTLTAGSGGSVNTNVLNNVLRRIENDQEEMTRQVFSLLVANMFMRPAINQNLDPGYSSNIQSGLLSSSVGELLSNQITNWLSQVDPRWNLGVNFVPGTSSSDIIVNLGRKFFDDRLEIKGSLGSGGSAYNDISASYSITKDGRFRVRAFNRTGTLNTYDNTTVTQRNRNINTQGLGIFYRIEFDNLSPERKAARRMIENARRANGSL